MATKDLNHYKKYGWKTNETNLATLPPTAPEEIKGLIKWLTLQGRRGAIKEWLELVQPDGRIHGNFWHIGAWTHRMSHSKPNMANTSANYPEDDDGVKVPPRNAVEEVKYKYDSESRALFRVADDSSEWLVGTDAEGIQLRVLAHYLQNQAYVDAIVSGKKEDKTDIHNVNLSNLGNNSLTRDHAKTFIYAWLLGAGTGKIAEILECNNRSASAAVQYFIDNTHGLKKLKKIDIPRDASRGYFLGLDGRHVPCTSEHLMLAGYLQNGEAVIMKRATVLWYRWAKEEGIDFSLVNFVHDEWQTIVRGTLKQAERLGELQCKALEQVGKDLNLFCPIAGKYVVGKNWKETH